MPIDEAKSIGRFSGHSEGVDDTSSQHRLLRSLSNVLRSHSYMEDEIKLNQRNCISILNVQKDPKNSIEQFSSLPIPNLTSCITSLQSCADQTNLQEGKKIHAYMLINGFLGSPRSITSLINMYSKCNSISDAFTSLSNSQLNVFAYNAIIAGFIHNEMPEPAFQVYTKMLVAGVSMDKYTFPCVVKALSSCGDVVGLKVVHGLIFKFGVDHDLFVGSAVVDGYLKLGLIVDAQKLFDEMPDRDVLWNTMINRYAQIGEHNKALECLQRLRIEGNVPSRFTVTGILSVLTMKGDLDNGKSIHGFATKMSYSSGIAVCNANPVSMLLISMKEWRLKIYIHGT